MKVRELMSNSVSCVRPDTSLGQVARQMRQEDVGAIPVCNDRGEPVGIITDRDLVIRALASGNPPMVAKDVMSRNLVEARPDMNTHEAALLLAEHQVRRLPVVENQKLVGMLSMADIARRRIYVDEAGDALSAISKPTPVS